ncbi:flagellar protein FliO/FliZ [Thermodesulfitimonas autotrophica]|uniref:Flagellar protein n=1 Tax=Thermodesulfitimonas autotrophica TaxID=1894989 RepID=A0A3N5AE47_9THEO|nr:flagellar biosynthetic protein FliO [Thermodesulfitimonas autotrophica]RPF42927.1 flagellar protein FliO/FliZ [Thermodesulfitimonas autotrophica]
MSSDLFWAVVRLLICLPIILALMYIVLRYGLSHRLLPVRSGRHIRVIEQVPLGPKTIISLVKVGERCYLLGHGEGTVAVLREVEGTFPEEPEPGSPGFDQVIAMKIRQAMRRR